MESAPNFTSFCGFCEINQKNHRRKEGRRSGQRRKEMRRYNKRIPDGFPAWMYEITQERNRKREIILSIGQKPKKKAKKDNEKADQKPEK